MIDYQLHRPRLKRRQGCGDDCADKGPDEKGPLVSRVFKEPQVIVHVRGVRLSRISQTDNANPQRQKPGYGVRTRKYRCAASSL
jgi:hypothetical protein